MDDMMPTQCPQCGGIVDFRLMRCPNTPEFYRGEEMFCPACAQEIEERWEPNEVINKPAHPGEEEA